MTAIINFIFNNFFLFVIILLAYYLYRQYKDLKDKTIKINDLFDKTLNKYLETKINEAKETTDRILKEYGREDAVSTEINRLLFTIEKGVTGTINDKVKTSNAINKFKLSKKIDLEKYPYLEELNNLGTFTEEDLDSKDNGVAIARRGYNTQAFRYNEKTGTFIIQYLAKLFKLPERYIIFEAPKSDKYEEIYEVFEEEEPEINSLASLNRTDDNEEKSLNDLLLKNDDAEKEEVVIEHSDLVLKPTNIDGTEQKN